jgi:O-antigen/teichoic acid export membrane protein
MAEKTSSVHLLGNSAWNAAAFLVGVGLNLLILPFVVFRLGLAAFGVAGLVTACVAPALAFSNALALSTTRELAQRLVPEQRDDARRFFATALLMAIGIGGVIVLILSFGGPSLARLAFHLNGSAAGDLELAFVFGAGGWFCQCLSGVVLALFTARQDYPRIASIGIASVIISTASMLVLIPRWPHASTFLGCQALGFATSLVLAFAFSCRVMGEWLARPAIHREPLGDLFHLGVWQFAAQGGGLIAMQADRYLLGAFLQPQFVGFYTISQRLMQAVYMGILKVGEILFPFFSSLQKESSGRIADLLFRSSWVLNVLAASALGALIPVAGPLLHLWTGAEVAAQAQQVLVVLSVSGIMGCSVNVFSFYLLANGRSRSIALISLVMGVFTLATSAVALPYFGWQAAGWSSLVGVAAQIAITIILLRQSFELADMWSRVAHFVLLPLGTGIATALVLRYLAGDQLFDVSPRWWYVGGSYGLAAGIIFVIVVAVSRMGPYGAVCWRDLAVIVSRFLPVKVA